MIEQLTKMLEMQKALNAAIMQQFKLTPEDIEKNIFWAVLDELGEWCHELKPAWCWWKKNKGHVDRERELEEFVDIWHFVMSVDLFNFEEDIRWIVTDSVKTFNDMTCASFSTPEAITGLLGGADNDPYARYPSISYLLVIMNNFGYSMDEIYRMYLKKNKENYERLQNGY